MKRDRRHETRITELERRISYFEGQVAAYESQLQEFRRATNVFRAFEPVPAPPGKRPWWRIGQ